MTYYLILFDNKLAYRSLKRLLMLIENGRYCIFE